MFNFGFGEPPPHDQCFPSAHACVWFLKAPLEGSRRTTGGVCVGGGGDWKGFRPLASGQIHPDVSALGRGRLHPHPPCWGPAAVWAGRVGGPWPLFEGVKRGRCLSYRRERLKWGGGVVVGWHRWHVHAHKSMHVCYDRVGWCSGHMASSNWSPYWPVYGAGGWAVSQLDLSDGIASTSLITPRTTSLSPPFISPSSHRLRHL